MRISHRRPRLRVRKTLHKSGCVDMNEVLNVSINNVCLYYDFVGVEAARTSTESCLHVMQRNQTSLSMRFNERVAVIHPVVDCDQ